LAKAKREPLAEAGNRGANVTSNTGTLHYEEQTAPEVHRKPVPAETRAKIQITAPHHPSNIKITETDFGDIQITDSKTSNHVPELNKRGIESNAQITEIDLKNRVTKSNRKIHINPESNNRVTKSVYPDIDVNHGYNSVEHLPPDPFVALFLSHYGKYLPAVHGFGSVGNRYRNLYSYLASNNIHNNKPFGSYKIYEDSDG